jgi:hypothetical protein
MHCVVSLGKLRKKYKARSAEVLQAIGRLGNVLDVEDQAADDIQAGLARFPTSQMVCLIGGYDLVPAFRRDNPTAHLDSEDDKDIMTDAPYGAAPGEPADEYAPDRAIGRIPDGARMKADDFLAILESQRRGLITHTLTGTYGEAAAEFHGAAEYVRKTITRSRTASLLSPPVNMKKPDPTALLTGQGRIHILLHGADVAPDWEFLWGRGPAKRARYVKALSAAQVGRCNLDGSVVTFSSCYSAMLDGAHGRTPRNQIALACLARGAKLVLGSTRSNWIPTRAPYNVLGPGLVGRFWSELRKPHATAGAALVRAKNAFLKHGLAGDELDRPYLLKTVLQANLYGHPGARL